MTSSLVEKPKTDYAARDAKNNRVLRWASDTLCLWGLCAKAKCRRARQCRGEPSDCVKQYMTIVPEDAYEGVELLLEGKRRKMTFEEVCAEWPDVPEAVNEWATIVMTCADKGTRA